MSNAKKKIPFTYSCNIANDYRLKEVADKLRRSAYSPPSFLHKFSPCSVVQCVVGPSHLAFLLDDGRVCRVAYSLLSESLDLSKGPSDGATGGGNSNGSNKT